MKKVIVACSVVGWLLVAGMPSPAHPHFVKTITVTLPGGVEASVNYLTVPANETYAAKAAAGELLATRRQPRLRLSAELKAGSVVIPAGDYIIGAIKNSDDDWTMALYPGQLAPGGEPDPTKLIKLESMYLTLAAKVEHMSIDISPGTGIFEGKAVLTWSFGSMFLAGALS